MTPASNRAVHIHSSCLRLERRHDFFKQNRLMIVVCHVPYAAPAAYRANPDRLSNHRRQKEARAAQPSLSASTRLSVDPRPHGPPAVAV
mgnify:CR=1 FL=1